MKAETKLTNNSIMKKTPLKQLDFPFSVSHESTLVFVGSCFAENLSKKLTLHGFHVLANPFGVLFHPFAIAKVLSNALKGVTFKPSVVQREDVFLSWDTNGSFYGIDFQCYIEKLDAISHELKKQLQNTNVLFLTFGTAWVYNHLESKQYVANCHKFPAQQFEKSLASVAQMNEMLKTVFDTLLKLNPSLKIVLTVSPVRHVKDGIVENTRSKARLIELVHTLVESNQSVYYFPAYELVLDELRDYAFFEADGVHPNDYAIERIWDYFTACFFDAKTNELATQFAALSKQFNHIPLHKESKAVNDFKQKLAEKIRVFKIENPYLNYTFLERNLMV